MFLHPFLQIKTKLFLYVIFKGKKKWAPPCYFPESKVSQQKLENHESIKHVIKPWTMQTKLNRKISKKITKRKHTKKVKTGMQLCKCLFLINIWPIAWYLSLYIVSYKKKLIINVNRIGEGWMKDSITVTNSQWSFFSNISHKCILQDLLNRGFFFCFPLWSFFLLSLFVIGNRVTIYQNFKRMRRIFLK